MNLVARGLWYTDLQFQGETRIIATAVINVPGGVALVDPGPSSCLDRLRVALGDHGATISDVQSILLTHIHLDHAGVTGSLIRENPRIQVFVHEKGARHMIDPTRLLDSARRLWGEDMDRLWGEVRPVPAENLQSLSGGETLTIGERKLEVAYTPGHASHHVSYFDREASIAFVGDAAGIRVGSSLYVLPPTPPPDIDLEAWELSLDTIEGWRPSTLFVTHFGPHEGAAPHLQVLRDYLDEFSRMARRILEGPGTDEERQRRFTNTLHRHLLARLSEQDAERYERAASPVLCWLGLARYWKKKLTSA